MIINDKNVNRSQHVNSLHEENHISQAAEIDKRRNGRVLNMPSFKYALQTAEEGTLNLSWIHSKGV